MKKNVDEIVSAERKTYGLKAFSQMVMPVAKSILGQKGFVEVDIITNWGNIVGEELADFTFPQRIDFKRGCKNNGVLHVNVPSGAFALELQHRERFIIDKLNTYFGYQAVATLKILQNNDLSIRVENKYPLESKNKTLVSIEEENYIKDLSEDVENPQLQEMLIKLGRSILSNNKGDKKNEV